MINDKSVINSFSESALPVKRIYFVNQSAYNTVTQAYVVFWLTVYLLRLGIHILLRLHVVFCCLHVKVLLSYVAAVCYVC